MLNIKYMVLDHALFHSYPTTDSSTSTCVIWVMLNMLSAVEECHELSGNFLLSRKWWPWTEMICSLMPIHFLYCHVFRHKHSVTNKNTFERRQNWCRRWLVWMFQLWTAPSRCLTRQQSKQTQPRSTLSDWLRFGGCCLTSRTTPTSPRLTRVMLSTRTKKTDVCFVLSWSEHHQSVYRMFQKSSPLKPFGIFSLWLSLFFVWNFANLLAVHIHISTNF